MQAIAKCMHARYPERKKLERECVCVYKEESKQTNTAQVKSIKKKKKANLPSLSLTRGVAELGLYLHWPRQQT